MNKSLLNEAIKVLAIKAVYLRSADVGCKDGFLPQFIEDDLSLVPQYRVGPTGRFHVVTSTDEESGASTKSVLFYFVAGVRLIDNALLDGVDKPNVIPENAIYVNIQTELCAQYSLNNANAVDADELSSALEQFSRYNVRYHVWPYWREYVQSVCNRMGIPPIPVPMYRLPQNLLDAKEGSGADGGTPAIDEILLRAQKRKFAKLYETADAEARELIRSLVERVRTEYPDIQIYPIDKPALCFKAEGRVVATLDLKKRAPYLRLNLLDIPDAIPSTQIEFRTTRDTVLSSCVVISSKVDLDDALRYLGCSVANAK